jgi:hypothetical protein
MKVTTKVPKTTAGNEDVNAFKTESAMSKANSISVSIPEAVSASSAFSRLQTEANIVRA